MNVAPIVQSDFELSEHLVSYLGGEAIDSFIVKHTDIRFHLIEGRAWITVDDNDIIVETGETICIPVSPYPVIISAANPQQTIRYQLS